ncbi:MAG: hypothetical protein UU16_C0051G0010 [Candidatus Woesebacteria bacterium GW2011_GWA2_40_7]|uniref:Uncharacterized protein n=2 Tax=Candidatus Woeseibacteriota TaxID=1752722 RepID=A0A0G0P0D9_9BACT|nr:MAG: hypothetical protein UT17_C0005G0004 [Candidatus Woesebacteria bacterium GW2011_GWB1_39_10]KKR71877.1 MAG: hypothetical protein UU16_C0051G0010 [Candidatus Woesebacteria bacterium GW2011_GWA2_40_7]
MPNIVDTYQQIEWGFANALEKFLPDKLEWVSSLIGYPVLYQKGFWGIFQGQVAQLTGMTSVTIKSSKWKESIISALHKYEAENDVTINVHLDF